MSKKIYVGNISWSATEEQLEELFGEYGKVHSVKIITDRETGRPRGFAFVEMDNADAAISALNNKDFLGRSLKVNEAMTKR
ncbi:MAG: RNA-binding protein [Candidatus Cloacimonas sp. SDB]|nr:MAG: RNA-binding protein [Candidatus Cloacimonas sp. SDB]